MLVSASGDIFVAMVAWQGSFMTNYASFIYTTIYLWDCFQVKTHILLRPEAHHAPSRVGTLREPDSEVQSVWYRSMF